VSYDEPDTNRCQIVRGRAVLNENSETRDVYDAVADPTRRNLLRLLADVEEMPLHELTVQFQMGRTAVSKHLTILKEAGLVLDRKVGRETRFRLNASPLREIQDWLAFYSKFWSTNMLRLNQLLEEEEE
jgi:DNA-binding transcriptional ArsR family regulator